MAVAFAPVDVVYLFYADGTEARRSRKPVVFLSGDRINSEPNTERTFKCYECGLEFEEKSDFVAHWLEHVRGKVKQTSKKKKKTGPFKCKICKTKFKKKSTLKKHLRKGCHPSTGVPNASPEAQGQTELYSCSFCDYVATYQSQIKTHLVIHSDLRPFKCDLCTAAFKINYNLKKHTRECHTHSEERPFKCDECPNAFKNRSALNNHKASIHSDLRPFKCNFCDASFKLKAVLTSHQRVHFNLRPYPCDLCDYFARRKEHLNKHKRRIHNME
ncbi:unnamed protein product [Bemisia tabaci]|uniref:C2H2-type domain-containing protein n=1 Tax=Bemisia tabaci TaxID=7038 RepID=A0A9P0AMD7_BEMTA|nr:unnamed protein product [Bemisia tabaci]